MICWYSVKAPIAAVMDGPMNMSAQCRQAPSSTCLPSTRTSLQSPDSAPCAAIRLSALDFPPPGSPPRSMFRSARLTWTCSPFSSMPRWSGSKAEYGNALGVGMVVASFRGGQGEEPAPERVRGAAVLAGRFHCWRVSACSLPASRAGGTTRSGVITGGTTASGVTGGAQLADVGLEVLGADPGPAQHAGAFADLGRPGPQHQRQPSGAGVQPGFVAEPLDAVPGQDAPEPAGHVPAGAGDGQKAQDDPAEGDRGPGQGHVAAEPPDRGASRGCDEQFGAPPPGHACRGAVEPGGQVIEDVGVVPLVAIAAMSVRRHGRSPPSEGSTAGRAGDAALAQGAVVAGRGRVGLAGNARRDEPAGRVMVCGLELGELVGQRVGAGGPGAGVAVAARHHRPPSASLTVPPSASN